MRSGGELDAIVNLDPAINALVDGGDAVVLVRQPHRGRHQRGLRRAVSRRLPLCENRIRESQSQHLAGDRERDRPRDAMAARRPRSTTSSSRCRRNITGPTRSSIASRWRRTSRRSSGTASCRTRRSRASGNSISVLEPDFRQAKIDMDEDLRQHADRAGAGEIPGAAEGVSGSCATAAVNSVLTA